MVWSCVLLFMHTHLHTAVCILRRRASAEAALLRYIPEHLPVPPGACKQGSFLHGV